MKHQPTGNCYNFKGNATVFSLPFKQKNSKSSLIFNSLSFFLLLPGSGYETNISGSGKSFGSNRIQIHSTYVPSRLVDMGPGLSERSSSLFSCRVGRADMLATSRLELPSSSSIPCNINLINIRYRGKFVFTFPPRSHVKLLQQSFVSESLCHDPDWNFLS